MSLTLLPAVDVRDGKAVRLRQGESGSETDYGSPLEAARTWVESGAEWIHLVDLDAAFGTGNNRDQLRAIVKELGDKVNIEMSGGVRDDASLDAALEAGAARVNIGTAALENPDWTASVIKKYGDRVAVGLDVRFIRLWFTDVLGTLKSVAIAPAELEAAFEEGLGFDGSAVEGLTRVSEDDMIVKPDPSTFQILPWRGGPQGTARMICDVLTPDGEPSLGDPRHVLKQALAKAKEKGFTFYVHPEIEFYLFEKQDDWAQTPKPIDEGGYFDHVPRSPGMDFRRATVNMLEQMGISVEYSHHEAGPGQNEIDLRYADALTTADNIMTFRTVVKEISLERGIHASFMPKPLSDAPGSGMHTHLSLFEGDANAFYEAGQEFNMSVTARQFAAGILYHAAEICAVTDQYVNSYKRLWGGAEAPSYICWGHNNRSALLRIPQYKPGKGNSARMEFRALDPVANPYLAYSVLLAAGLDGIDKQMQLGEPTSDDVWELTDAERQAMGIQPLPESLDEALKIMEKSDFVADVLGGHAFEYFLRNKHQEWDEYRKQVTPFELKKYLPKL